MKLLPIVKQIEGPDNQKRLKAVKEQLKKYSIPYKIEKFETGENIIIGKGDVLFVAHHDTVPGSFGANDNASAIAVLMGLAKARKAAIVIFGEEEVGCVGTKAYIRSHELPKAVVDLEMMGMGDIMAIWPVAKETPLLNKVRQGLKKANIYFEEAKRVPIFWADFTAFREAGLENSLCLTLVPSSEKKLIRSFSTRPWLTGIMVLFRKTPKFFKHYHSKHDNSLAISEKSLQLSLKAITSVYDVLKK